MNSHIVSEIVKNLKNIEWSKAPNLDASWIVVMKLPLGNHHLGINVNGQWVTESGLGGLIDITDNGGFEPLLPFMRNSLKSFLVTLKSSVMDKGVPVSVLQSFPFDEFICYAGYRGGYWRDLVLNWIDQGYPMSYQIALSLGEGDEDSTYIRNWKKDRIKRILFLSD